MNRVVTLLILSDILIAAGFGLVEPIFSIFVKEGLLEGSLVAAGIASMIFLIVQSITLLPIAYLADKNNYGEFFLIAGALLIALVPLLYAYSTHTSQIYLVQILYGLGAAMQYPAWLSLFSSNVDKKRENFEWAFHSTAIGIGTALSAYLGAALVHIIGFRLLFLVVFALTITGTLILFFLGKTKKKTIYLYKHVFSRDKLGRFELT